MFDYTVEGLLLNLFFIMFPLIFYQFIIDEKSEGKPVIRNVLSYFLFAGSTILCMVFPVMKQTGLIFDYRIIPFILACLYCQRMVSILIFLTLIYARFMIPGQGAYLNIISVSIALILILMLQNKYHALPLLHKIISVSFLSFACKIISIMCNILFDPDYQLSYAFFFYSMQAIFMGLTIYVIESISKSVQLRQELIASEKMKVVSVISASVAHEIRNPLTAVRGFIQLLTQSELGPDKKLQYGSICLEELDRAQQIINDYLSLAKPQPDTIDKLEVTAEISYVSKVMNSYANMNGVEILVESDEELYIFGDRSKFRQSMINLAKNGIEAMIHCGGMLKITVKRQKQFVNLLIIDNGNGMTNEQMIRLGTPYFSNKEKGTGLGTMVSYHIIKNMMGKINIKSEVGKGTEYSILFPHV